MALQSFDEALVKDKQPFIVTIGDKEYEGYIACIRIDRDTVPKGWHVYDLRHAYSGSICEIKNGYITFDHAGTFYTQDELDIPVGQSVGTEDGFDYSFE